jgi:hypothetical protein
MTDIDLTTGLPEVPEGHFWRLTEDLGGDLVLMLRRSTPKNLFKKDFLVMKRNVLAEEHYLAHAKSGTVKGADIQRAAKEIMDLLAIQQEAESRRGLLGDYPPKNLRDELG